MEVVWDNEESVRSKSIVEFLYTSKGGLTKSKVPSEALVISTAVGLDDVAL